MVDMELSPQEHPMRRQHNPVEPKQRARHQVRPKMCCANTAIPRKADGDSNIWQQMTDELASTAAARIWQVSNITLHG